jgi:regulator of sirC expression with transglutaminase-like and TPR domain
MRRDKQKQLFIELVNKQLEPHGKTYEDVINIPNWYTQFKTTAAAEKEFAQYAKKRIMEDLKLSAKLAENEVNWFILQWGLSVDSNEYKDEDIALFARKDKFKMKPVRK